jgi:tRNA nucleotidyltransferase (CCA-adding enzyme)
MTDGSDRPALDPPADFKWVADTLESHGFEAWAVGGALRNPSARDRDWDVATSARPDDVRRIFQRTVPIGIEHGTIGVLARDGAMYEVTTFRLDVETDGRHAVVSFADTIEEDLARRDFTINAMAWRPATDEWRDPFDGHADLARGVLRAVGDPAARFAEDYLRVLRGLRFAGHLSLEIDPPTRDALEQAVPGLERLSAERVREELFKVLDDPVPSSALSLYGEAGALSAWYPELQAVAADPEVWPRVLKAVDVIPPHRAILRCARWLLPIGEDGEGRTDRAKPLLDRLKFSNADARRVLHLLRHYQPFIGPMDSAAQLRQWLAEVGRDAVPDLFRLHFADARASAEPQMQAYLVAAWRSVHDEMLTAPPLTLADLAIGGDELLALGVPRGPLIGLLLDELHAQVLEDPDLNEPAALAARARALIEPGGLLGRESEHA